MIWAYVLENQGVKDTRSNQPIFLLIRQLHVADDNIVVDSDTDRVELKMMLSSITTGSHLIVRSVLDMADTLEDMLQTLKILSEKGVTIYSHVEQFLNDLDYLTVLTGCIEIEQAFRAKKREMAYQKAKVSGKVGRPKKKEVAQALTLYENGVSVAQVEAVTGVSKSTLYRHIKKKQDFGK